MRGEAQRYDKVAIDALQRELERILLALRTRGLLPEPKSDAAMLDLLAREMAKLSDSPVLLRVGDRMVIPTGEWVTVTAEYGIYRFATLRGRFHADRGERVDYLLGYSVRTDDGRELAARPCQLTRADGAQSHLKLLNGGATAVERQVGISTEDGL
jgi:hypothetical protein